MKNRQPFPFLPTDQRGSLLIILIVSMSIIAVAGAAMLSLVASSTYSELAAGRHAAAYYLAESGGRFAIPQIKKDRDQAKADLDGKTYTPADGQRFHLEIDTSSADYTYLTATGTVNPGGWTEAQARITFRIPTPPVPQEIISTFGAKIQGLIYAPYSNLNFTRDSTNRGTFVGNHIDIRNSTKIYGVGRHSGGHSGGCHSGRHPGGGYLDYVIFANSTDDPAISLSGAPTVWGRIGTNGTVTPIPQYMYKHGRIKDKHPTEHAGLLLEPPPDPPLHDPPNRIIDLSNVRYADSPVEITDGSYNCVQGKININDKVTVNINGQVNLVADSFYLASSAELNINGNVILDIPDVTLGGDSEINISGGDVTMIVDNLTVTNSARINIAADSSLTVFARGTVKFEGSCKVNYELPTAAPELFTLYGNAVPPQAGPVIQYFPDQ